MITEGVVAEGAEDIREVGARATAWKPSYRRWWRRLRPFVLAIVSLAAVGGLWQLLDVEFFNPTLVPLPASVARTAVQMARSGELGHDLAVSLKRVLVGYFIGCGVGVVTGALIGYVRPVRELLWPVIQLVRPISPVAMVPLALLWFGIGETGRYFVIFYATVIVVLLNTAEGVALTPMTRVRAARCFGGRRWQIFFFVVLPSAVPFILAGMRIAVGFAFMGVVAAEMLAATSGIGYLIMQSQQLMNPSRIFVGLLALAGLGAATDFVFRIVIDRLTRRYMQYQLRPETPYGN